jgi:hypothetical protein
MALTYSNITASTLKHYEKKLYDNVFRAYPLLERMLSKGQVKEFESGEKIFIPIEYGENSNIGWIKKNGTIPLNEDEIITAAEDDWRILAGSVKFNDLDNVLNRGEAQIVDLMKTKIKNLEKGMKKNLATCLHTAQTGDAMNGLPDIVSTSTTLHGIAVADFAGWIASYANNTAEPLAIIDMTTAYNTCSDGADHVDLIDSSQTLFEKYESLVAPQLRFSDSKTADAGFENLKFKGAILVLDKLCTSDRQYYLNTDYLYLACVKDRKFHAFPAVPATNQIEEAVKVVFYGNLMTSNRRMQGMLDGRTA